MIRKFLLGVFVLLVAASALAERWVPKDSTDKSIRVVLTSSTTGLPSTGLTVTDIDVYVWREGATVTAKFDCTDLGSENAAHSDTGAYEGGALGIYRIDLPDAAFATGADYVDITVVCSGCINAYVHIALTNANPNDGVRLGLTALPNAAAGAAGGLPDDTDGNGRVRVVDGTGAGEIDTTSGRVGITGLADASAAFLDDMLDGTGAVLTLSQLRINSAAAGGAVDVDNSGGPGIKIDGTTFGIDCQASAGPGAYLAATGGNGAGMSLAGNGTGDGLYAVGGAEANGAHFYGGSTVGNGLYARGQTTGYGISAVGAGASSGVSAVGGTNANGIYAQGNGVGAGARFSGQPGAGTGNGLSLSGGGSGGSGLVILAVENNAAGVSITGHGSGDGMIVTGGATGDGIHAVGQGGAYDINADIFGGLTGNITGNLSGSVGSLTGHTNQTGDSFARLGAPAGASIAADLLTIDNLVDDLEGRLTNARAGYLDNLAGGAVATDADLTTLLGRITAVRAGYLDAAISTRARPVDVQIIIP